MANKFNIVPSDTPEEVLAREAQDLSEDLAVIANWAEVLTTESCTEVRINGLTIIQDRAARMSAVLAAVQDYLQKRGKL
jgi:hypothetical protein